MRIRRLLLLLGGLAVAACGREPTAAAPRELDADLAADVAASEAVASTIAVTMAGPPRLPEALRLSEEQKAAIALLTRQLAEATATDRAALERLLRQARAAHQAGRPWAEIQALLDEARPIRRRLQAALEAHRAAVLALLTPAQRAWLEEQQRRCDPRRALQLTDAQRAQIAALHEAFVDANRADLELVRTVLAEARAAAQAGKPEAEIRAILERARPAQQRLEAAYQALRAAVDAVLTPEQRAARCP